MADGDADPYYEGRELAPAARYAATETPGVRWHDTETGQEHFALAVGVEDLLDVGATIGDPDDDTDLVSRVELKPNARTGGWSVRINRIRLDQHVKRGSVRFVGTQTYARTDVFDDREVAVEHAMEHCDEYALAEVRDAAAWCRGRRVERDEEAKDAE